jgi:Helix-turn-helix domain
VPEHLVTKNQKYRKRAGLKSDASADIIDRVQRLEAARPPPSVLANFIDEASLARQLDVGVRTLREWRRLGKGPVPTWVGRKLFFRIESIDSWLRSREQAMPRQRVRRRQTQTKSIDIRV